MRTRYAALAATLMLLAALTATLLLSAVAGAQPASTAQQTSQDSPAPCADAAANPHPDSHRRGQRQR